MPSEAASRRDHAAELRRDLADPATVAEALGLERSREERAKWVCPRHKGGSLSLTLGRDRTVRVRCFGCDLAGDVLSLVAEVRGLTMRGGDFPRVLLAAAELAGRWDLVAELEGRERPAEERKAPKFAPRGVAPEPEIPALDAEAFHALAAAIVKACPLTGAADVRAYLEGRGLYLVGLEAGWGALPPLDGQRALVAELAATFGRDVLDRSGLVRGDAFVWSEHRLAIPWYGPDERITLMRRRLVAPAAENVPRYVSPRGRGFSTPYAGRWGYVEDAHDSAEVVAYVEGEADAVAFRWLWRHRWNDARRVLVLGLGGLQGCRATRAAFAKGRHAIVAIDADESGREAVEALSLELYKAGATKVTDRKPKAGKDWASMLVETNA